MKKHLKRLWDFTGTTSACLVVAAAVAAVNAWGVWALADRYGADLLLNSPAYAFGYAVCLASLATFVLIVVGTVTLVNRRWPRPLPVHEDYPPTELVYLQGEGEPERCTCHNRPIKDGTVILHWPQPAQLVCLPKAKDKGRHR